MNTQDPYNPPRNVVLAVRLLYGSATLVAILTLVTWAGWLNFPLDRLAVITNLVTITSLALVANQIGKRKNWARWLFAAIYAVGTLLGALLILFSRSLWESLPATGMVTAFVQAVLQTSALILVFTRSANNWFRRNPTTQGSAI